MKKLTRDLVVPIISANVSKIAIIAGFVIAVIRHSSIAVVVAMRKS